MMKKISILFVVCSIVIIGSAVLSFNDYWRLQFFAHLGDADAQDNLGFAYWKNHNQVEAEKWYMKASEKNMHAKAVAGVISFFKGNKDKKSCENYIKIETEAANSGEPYAQSALAYSYLINPSLTNRCTSIDYQKSLYWAQKAISNSQARCDTIKIASKILGMVYINGFGVKKDYKKSFDVLTKGADCKSDEAYTGLGVLYLNGLGVSKNIGLARKYWELAAEQNNAEAQFNLSMYYYNGREGVKDFSKSLIWLEKSAAQNYPDAQLMLGYLYQEGENIPQNKLIAVSLYQKAANQENALAQVSLANMFFKGEGIPENYETAYMWAIIARASNDTRANAPANQIIQKLNYMMSRDHIQKAQNLAIEWWKNHAAGA